MRYLTIEDCKKRIFEDALKFDEKELTERYENNAGGVVKLGSVLESVQTDYYEDFFQKASFLFVSINKGHFFNNGNKRLALVILINFLHVNRVLYRIRRKETYLRFFESRFPDYQVSNQEFNYLVGWATYNLNRAVAQTGSDKESFDFLKGSVEIFLKTACEMP